MRSLQDLGAFPTGFECVPYRNSKFQKILDSFTSKKYCVIRYCEERIFSFPTNSKEIPNMSRIIKSENEIFTIEISEDNFTATLSINSENATKYQGFIDETELINLVKKAKIAHGFEEAFEKLQNENFEKKDNIPFIIATGVKSKEPEIEFSPLFNTDKGYNDSIGNKYHLLNNFARVNKGEALAHLFITKHSKPGMDIFGNSSDPDFSEENLIENYLGENVTYSKERGQIIASKTGYPYMDDTPKIHVKSDFVLDTNLDLTFEDMDFYGSMIINGDVIDKVKLKLTGDLTIKGNIKDADIDVNGNIFVEGDIVNCKNPGIYATGSVNFTSAENSKIVAGDKINFQKHIHFCKVIAENGLYGNENTGAIIGGVYESGEHIETAVLGNMGGISTEVEISISPYRKEKMSMINKQMSKLKDLELENSKDYLLLHEELNKHEMALEEEINNMLKMQENLPKHIIAYKKVFPATYVRILKKAMHVTDELNRVNFSIVDGELTIETY